MSGWRAASMALLMAVTTDAAAQAAPWQPLSKTALSITGAIGLSARRLTMAGRAYGLRPARTIAGAELVGAGRVFSAATPPAAARLYAIDVPAKARLVGGNTICGAKPARFLLVTEGRRDVGRVLNLAFFSGDRAPSLDPASVAWGADFCGTFSYAR